MVNITLSLPTELKNKMDNFEEINWSAIARKAFSDEIRDLEVIKEFKSKSTLTEKDAIKLGRELNKKLVNRK